MFRSRFESRRRFVQGLAGGALVLASGRHLAWGTTTSTGTGSNAGPGAGSGEPELSGTDFHLEVGATEVNFTGASRRATVVNGRLPAPLLRWRQGDTVTIRVTNRLPAPTSIHWHGMILPADMDGVPGISFPGIHPGGTYEYRFPVTQAGTYWYHSHSRFQEQIGLYGPIVIEPRAGERHHADRDHVLLLSDWTDIDPERIYRLLKVQSDYFNYRRRTVGDFIEDARKNGLSATVSDRRMWGQMRMNASDLLDVSGNTYTYLMNGVTPAGNWTGLFRRGEKVRLRIINGSSMTFFDIRIPGLSMTVVAADGQDVEPMTVDEFRIGAAEVYDVIVEPKDDRAYTIFAQSMDRTGYARGTLAPAAGMEAEVPPLDPPDVLSMSDMGMNMESMHHGGSADHDMSQMDMAGHDMSQMNMPMPSSGRSPTFGPNVDMVADQPRTSLYDPGVGLRGNGRRVLTYADLHTIDGPIDSREPSREIRLHLTGHMQRYIWSFDGQKFSEAQPLRFNYGERLRVVLINDSMMNHPIHLHGMWSEVESPDGKFLVRKHTVVVQPGQQLSYRVTANAPGRWAFHCHLLYHMEAGMFREVAVVQE
ncbi:MAG: copper resistance system multicopper oxidase [Proteobacteria bacterium]|nr:copper resistance system multicopper oxidase [Pseudomonadota bacterium]